MALPPNFKFVYKACPLSSIAFSFSNHVLDGVELIIFIQKRRKKRVKCLFLNLKLYTTLQIGTSTIHSEIICLHFDLFNFPGE